MATSAASLDRAISRYLDLHVWWPTVNREALPKTITVPAMCDAHHHLRQDHMLREMFRLALVGPEFAWILAMPNLQPSILTGQQAVEYGQKIRAAGYTGGLELTIKLTAATTVEMIEEAHALGVRVVKAYTRGTTTHSDDGLAREDLARLDPIYAKMEALGMYLLWHGEMPGEEVEDREIIFLSEIERIAIAFPRLRITLEHISTFESVLAICQLPDNVSATITLHHLLVTSTDVRGGMFDVHLHCQPVAKRRRDRAALLWAAFSGSSKFRLGSDSAPHTRTAKQQCGCAGVFTAPVLLPVLAELFLLCGQDVEKLGWFISGSSRLWFDLDDLPKRVVVLNRLPWRVPDEYQLTVGSSTELLVPFMHGKTLQYYIRYQ